MRAGAPPTTRNGAGGMVAQYSHRLLTAVTEHQTAVSSQQTLLPSVLQDDAHAGILRHCCLREEQAAPLCVRLLRRRPLHLRVRSLHPVRHLTTDKTTDKAGQGDSDADA